MTKEESQLHLVLEHGGRQLAADLLMHPYEEIKSPTALLDARAAGHLPPLLSRAHPGDAYWFEFQSDKGLLYFQFSAIVDKPEEDLASFCHRLFKFIADNPVKYLVIDLRENGGGDNTLILPLIHGLLTSDKVNRTGHLFVIVGRNTFSAAMNTATALERETHPIFVGEPTGSRPNHVGEGTLIRLPCTGMQVGCSTLLWQDSDPRDRRMWIAPTLLAPPAIAHEIANTDPALAAIEAYVRAPSESESLPDRPSH
jgi:hypothetical protein